MAAAHGHQSSNYNLEPIAGVGQQHVNIREESPLYVSSDHEMKTTAAASGQEGAAVCQESPLFMSSDHEMETTATAVGQQRQESPLFVSSRR